MSESKRAASSLQAPAPGPAPAYGGAYACVVCGVSVRRTPALGCARCPCGPLHRACAPQSGPGAQTCPQCARPSVVPFTGALMQVTAAPGERVALAGAGEAADGPCQMGPQEVRARPAQGHVQGLRGHAHLLAYPRASASISASICLVRFLCIILCAHICI